MTEQTWLFAPSPSRRALTGQLVWFLIWLTVTFIGSVVLKPNPAGHGTHTQLGLPKCYSVIMFDRPCPGCGLTTSWTATMHGNLPHAFAANALGPIIYGLFTLSALLCIYGYIRQIRLRTETKLATASLIIMIVTFLAYGIIRFTQVKYNDPDHVIWKSFQAAEKSTQPDKNR